MAKLSIKLVRSTIAGTPKQKKTVIAMGLTKLQKTVVREDTPTLRGMIKVIAHLVEVKEV